MELSSDRWTKISESKTDGKTHSTNFQCKSYLSDKQSELRLSKFLSSGTQGRERMLLLAWTSGRMSSKKSLRWIFRMRYRRGNSKEVIVKLLITFKSNRIKSNQKEQIISSNERWFLANNLLQTFCKGPNAIVKYTDRKDHRGLLVCNLTVLNNTNWKIVHVKRWIIGFFYNLHPFHSYVILILMSCRIQFYI